MSDSSYEAVERMGDNKSHTAEFIGSIDQGTTSTRFLIFNKEGEPVASHQVEFKQIYPESGYDNRDA
jgi:glycerol kinase